MKPSTRDDSSVLDELYVPSSQISFDTHISGIRRQRKEPPATAP